jgi:hypothetical protein
MSCSYINAIAIEHIGTKNYLTLSVCAFVRIPRRNLDVSVSKQKDKKVTSSTSFQIFMILLGLMVLDTYGFHVW